VSPQRLLELAFIAACTVAIGIFVFDQTPAGPGTSPPLLYTPIPLLIWAALRFGLGGVSVSMLIITSLAIWGTMRGHGPFLSQTPVENALALQLFLLMTATPLMLLAVVIEEERRAKASLRQSKDQMALAAEAANAAMWVWDVSADELWMTEQGRSLFGFKPDARIDFAATMDRVHREDRAVRESAITRALETRGGYEIEYRLREPDGTVRWINGRARCLEPNDGTGLKLFGVSIDITARKQAEASAAQEREELQQKRVALEHVARVATLGELTATLTHELKQPLNAIHFNCSVAMQMLGTSHPDVQEIREIFSDISGITRQAGELIQGMRGMLKGDTPGFIDVDLNQLIRMVERIVHSDAAMHGVAVQLDLSPGVLRVMGDTVQLQQVMLNVMLNAIAAMEQSERAARRLVVRTHANDGSNVLVEVQDSGCGIAPEKLESIFSPFVTSKPDGLGMGLSICRSIVERHAGKIWAANNPDSGATFSIMLPISPGQGPSESCAAANAPAQFQPISAPMLG
jgi:PAS domain S-box-containing protein